jgi:hypothetical protein
MLQDRYIRPRVSCPRRRRIQKCVSFQSTRVSPGTAAAAPSRACLSRRREPFPAAPPFCASSLRTFPMPPHLSRTSWTLPTRPWIQHPPATALLQPRLRLPSRAMAPMTLTPTTPHAPCQVPRHPACPCPHAPTPQTTPAHFPHAHTPLPQRPLPVSAARATHVSHPCTVLAHTLVTHPLPTAAHNPPPPRRHRPHPPPRCQALLVLRSRCAPVSVPRPLRCLVPSLPRPTSPQYHPISQPHRRRTYPPLYPRSHSLPAALHLLRLFRVRTRTRRALSRPISAAKPPLRGSHRRTNLSIPDLQTSSPIQHSPMQCSINSGSSFGCKLHPIYTAGTIRFTRTASCFGSLLSFMRRGKPRLLFALEYVNHASKNPDRPFS